MYILVLMTGIFIGAAIGIAIMEQSKRKIMNTSFEDMMRASRYLTDKTDMLKMMSKSNELMMRFNNGSATSKELLALLDEQSALHKAISARAKQDA